MTYLLIGFFIITAIFMITGLSGAPWVPARAFDIDELLDDVKLKPGQIFFELGCGDGRLVKAAARRGATAIGYELNPLLWLIAKIRCWRVAGASVRLGDLWKVDLSKADVVMAFLVPRTMPRLHKKASQQLNPKARLVSYIFPIVGKRPDFKGSSWYIYSYRTKTPTAKI